VSSASPNVSQKAPAEASTQRSHPSRRILRAPCPPGLLLPPACATHQGAVAAPRRVPFPQRGWGVAVLTNGDNGEAVVDAVIDELVG
jgi:hypothetical protein